MKGEKMPTCTYCEKEVAEVEDWGIFKLCKSCVKEFKDDFPKPPNADISDVRIPSSPRLGAIGTYEPDTGETTIRQGCTWRMLHETINHEFIHFVLHRLEGLHCMYQFDNIFKEIDSYHGLS